MKSIDPSELNIINYLTGEMTSEEKRQFEMQLAENPLLQKQIDEMKTVQSQIGIWKNEDISVPKTELQSMGNTTASNSNNSSYKTIGTWPKFTVKSWMKYAAVFLGFLVVLQVSGLKLNTSGNTLMLSFGEPSIDAMERTNVDEIVASALEKYAQSQTTQLQEMKNQIDADLAGIGNAVNELRVANSSHVAQLENIFSKNMDEQYVSLETMIKGIENNQRQELENSFVGLVEYIENKRVTDQYRIQNAFSEIATAIDNQQNQTNALLTSISSEDAGLKSY